MWIDELRHFFANEASLIIGFLGTATSLAGIVAQKKKALHTSQNGEVNSKTQKAKQIFSLYSSGLLLAFSIFLIVNYYYVRAGIKVYK